EFMMPDATLDKCNLEANPPTGLCDKRCSP
ncbi:unnamed protein product, partial [marine sediment metagenome]